MVCAWMPGAWDARWLNGDKILTINETLSNTTPIVMTRRRGRLIIDFNVWRGGSIKTYIYICIQVCTDAHVCIHMYVYVCVYIHIRV